MEPRREPGVQPPVRRLTPTMIAAIALAVLVLAIGAFLVVQGRNGADDRLTGNESAATSQEDPEQRCSGRSTYDQIKRELFRRAAAVRGSDQAAIERIGSYSVLRVEAPILRDQNDAAGTVACSATFWLDLPPGVAVAGGRTSLSAEILYTIQPAEGGGGDAVSLANAEEIITPLATLSRIGAPPESQEDTLANEAFDEASIEPADPLAPVDEPAAAPPPRAGASPSFNCANARTSGEVAVCRSPGLAALDRAMASQYSAAMARADPEQRAILLRTRDSFLRFRDGCPSDACIAQTYRGRMREIRDIMTGAWRP